MALAPEDQGALIGAGLVTNPTQIAAARAVLIARMAAGGSALGPTVNAGTPPALGNLTAGQRLDFGTGQLLDAGGVPYGYPGEGRTVLAPGWDEPQAPASSSTVRPIPLAPRPSHTATPLPNETSGQRPYDQYGEDRLAALYRLLQAHREPVGATYS